MTEEVMVWALAALISPRAGQLVRPSRPRSVET